MTASPAVLRVSDAAVAGIAAVIDGGDIRPAYQPVVDLDSGLAVGFEARARGPEGTPLERPGAMVAAAAAAGRLADLDRLCRIRAIEGAIAGGLRTPGALLCPVEPATAGLDAAQPPAALMRAALERMNLVAEFTERALAAQPAALVARLHAIRANGSAIAIDGVGAEEHSLAMLPIVEPEIVKLDLPRLRARGADEVARVITAVSVHVERTGGLVLAKGIRTGEDLAEARAFGAQLGLGDHFAPAGALTPLASFGPEIGLPRSTHRVRLNRTPFDLVAAVRSTHVAPGSVLETLSRDLEDEAARLPESTMLIATAGPGGLSGAAGARYAALARGLAGVTVFGAGIPPDPAPGVRGVTLAPGDRLAAERDLVVIGPDRAAALVAQQVGVAERDGDPRFAYAFTHDPELVRRLAMHLLARTAPEFAVAL